MASLTGNTIQSTYDSLLKVTDNDSITGSLKRITDGLGNNTPLYLSSSAVEIVSTLNVTSTITASNLSGTNTGDETKASIETKLGAATSSNSGYLTSTDWSTFNNKIAGTGTLNKLAKFSSSSSIADSTITDTGSAVTIGVATSVTGSLTASSLIRTGGTSSQFLKADGSVDSTSYQPVLTNPVTGTGTTNTIPKFTGTSTIGNSTIFDNGTNVGIGTTTPGTTLDAYKASGESGVQISSGAEYARLFYRDTDDNFGVFINGVTRLRLIGSTGNGALLESGTGNLAIGTTAATATTKLWVAGTGYFSDSVGIGNAGLTRISLRVSKSITGSVTSYGVVSDGTIQSDVTSNGIMYESNPSTAASAFTLTNLIHYNIVNPTIGSTSAITNQFGVNVANLTGATNNYGFRGAIAAGTGRWNLYMDGTANNHINGALGIGTTSLTTSSLHVGRNITGGTAMYGIQNAGIVQSDVTSFVQHYRSLARTAAASFTLGTFEHYIAEQGTIGAGSAITTQTGFLAASSIIGATNNFGFRGDIPSGTNRWNLYMAGTASNYLAGNLAIGTTALIGRSNLSINRNITGNASSFGIINQSQIQSDVTSFGAYNVTTASTQAATFTLTNLSHYYAEQGTLGAGSIVNTQMAFQAHSSLIGATTNIGFRGQIPSGTNRWNLYMDGTANNYLAGNLSIGTTSSTAELTIDTLAGFGVDIFRSDVAANYGAIRFRNTTNSSTFGSLGFDSGGLRLDGDAGTMYFSTSGTERMRITSGGAVGIGTTNPNTQLHVAGSITVNDVIYLQRASSSLFLPVMNYWNGSGPNPLNGTKGDIVAIGNAGGDGLVFVNSNTERMRINGSGNVGIGTTSPVRKFEVNGQSFLGGDIFGGLNSGIFFSGNGNYNAGIFASNSGNDLVLQSGTTERMRITSGGSVLTGTTTATYSGATFRSVIAAADTRVMAFNGTTNSSVWWLGSGSPQFAIDSISGGGATFWTNSGSWSERMRLNSSGRLLINKTADDVTGATVQVSGNISFTNSFNTQISNYTLVLGDQCRIIQTDNASANTVTVPLNSSVAFPVGTEIAILQYGAGQTQVVAASGVTIRSRNSYTKIADRYTGATLVKLGVNDWYLIGNLTA